MNSFGVIIEKIMKGIKKLETVGKHVHVNGLGERRIFASIANFAGEWLATNQLFGMIEGFRGDFPCYFVRLLESR
jgi:hypothetical protein